MSMSIVAVNLTKSRHSLLCLPVQEEADSRFVRNRLLEDQVGSW